MSETSNNKLLQNDEIDLLDLLKKIGRAIGVMSRAIGRGILISMVFLFRHWLPLFISVILGVGTAFLFKETTPSLFSSEMVLRTNSDSTIDVISYINRLHNFCRENNIQALSSAISIPGEKIQNISDIRAFWIIDNGKDGNPDYVDYSDNHNVYDTLNVRMKDRLDIRVFVNDPQILNDLKKGIIYFINSDSLFQQKNRLKQSQKKEMLARVNYDIKQLDSLQKVKYFEETRNMKPKNGGQMIFLQEHNTQLIYADIYSLYTLKRSIETELNLYKEITTILSEFSIPVRRINGGAYYAIRIVPVFFCLTLLFLILITNRKKLVDVYKKY
jgi:hypothetical protein